MLEADLARVMASELSETEATVVLMRFGAVGSKPSTLQEVGNKVGEGRGGSQGMQGHGGRRQGRGHGSSSSPNFCHVSCVRLQLKVSPERVRQFEGVAMSKLRRWRSQDPILSEYSEAAPGAGGLEGADGAPGLAARRSQGTRKT
jgi:hypothetical protein